MHKKLLKYATTHHKYAQNMQKAKIFKKNFMKIFVCFILFWKP